jgi:butyryl-CoA dehydrogenase
LRPQLDNARLDGGRNQPRPAGDVHDELGATRGGLQGLGLSEVSYQNAVSYARERLQSRNLSGARNPDGPADPIITHADIRRGLLSMRAFVQGGRALALWTAMRLDDEFHHPEPTARAEAADLVALLTPVIKAFFTDLAFESTNIGLQTLGGHGYIREYGMEQFVRAAHRPDLRGDSTTSRH